MSSICLFGMFSWILDAWRTQANASREQAAAARLVQTQARAEERARTRPDPAPLADPHAERIAVAQAMSQISQQNNLSIRFRGRGVYLDVSTANCSRAVLTALVSSPAVLEPLLRAEFRFVDCADTDENTEIRLPPPGVQIPASIEWNRSYVATPASRGRAAEHPPMWCTGVRPNTISVLCARTAEACAAHEQRARGIFADSELSTVIPCAPTQTLWCCDTVGSERVCFDNRDDCSDAQERHCGRNRCERRWAY
jgi:hypothetical protein